MESKEELEATRFAERVEKITAYNNKKNAPHPLSFWLMCFLIPPMGFIGSIIHIDSNNALAKKCLDVAWTGTLIIGTLAFF